MDIENSLFNIESLPHNKIKLHNYLHQIDDAGKYCDKPMSENNNNKELAELIHKNYSSMTPEELKTIALKCLSEINLRHILLKYEITNLQSEPLDIGLNEFSVIAKKLLLRYHGKAGGFNFGEQHWTEHTKTSRKFDLFDDEILYENTLDESKRLDTDTKEYLRNILHVLNNISTNVKVSLHYKFKERDKIYIVMLKCKEINRK